MAGVGPGQQTAGTLASRFAGLGSDARLTLVVGVVAVVPVLAAWGLFLHGLVGGQIGFFDFAVFYAAGSLVADGNGAHLYDAATFAPAFSTVVGGGVAAMSAPFASPPPFALAMVPFSLLEYGAAIVVWTVAGLAAAVVAFRWIGYTWIVSLVAVGALLLTRPGVSVVTEGQATFVWLLIFAGVFVLLRRNSLVGAGALAGLLILKPPLLVGVGVWWLVDRSKHRALMALAVSAGSILTATWFWMSEAWLSYPGSVFSFADAHRFAPGRFVQLSPWTFFDLAIPGSSSLALMPGVALSILGGAWIVRLVLRNRHDLSTAFAASIGLTLWLSPHVLVHDWALLALALGVLHVQHTRYRALARWSLVLAAASSVGLLISLATLPTLGLTIQIGVLALALVGYEYLHVDPSPTPSLEFVIDLRSHSDDTLKPSNPAAGGPPPMTGRVP